MSLNSRNSFFSKAFTLVELLVVIGIIALLISILLPTLGKARTSAKSVMSLSNLRQVGIGLAQYRVENRGLYPVASYASVAGRPRFRWADAIYSYMKSTEVYMSPQLSDDNRSRMNKPFHHTCDPAANPGIIAGKTIYWGGYGYNWQYLGNGRTTGGVDVFVAKEGAQIRKSAQTIAVADTHGSKNGGSMFTSEGVYVVDPPLMSVTLGSKGSRKTSATPGSGNYGYTGGADGDLAHRSTPAERNGGKVAILFCDGHGDAMTLKQLDDFNNDGQADNGWWNGKADPTVR